MLEEDKIYWKILMWSIELLKMISKYIFRLIEWLKYFLPFWKEGRKTNNILKDEFYLFQFFNN